MEKYSADAHMDGPRRFWEIPRLWLRILRLTERFLSEEMPRVSGPNTLASVALLGVSGMLVFALALPQLRLQRIPPLPQVIYEVERNLWLALGSAFIGIVAGFYLFNGAIYVIAHVLGGKGSFVAQAYLISLGAVPLAFILEVLALAGLMSLPTGQYVIVNAVAYAIIAMGIVGLYLLVLCARATAVAHDLRAGQAWAAVLLAAALGAAVWFLA